MCVFMASLKPIHDFMRFPPSRLGCRDTTPGDGFFYVNPPRRREPRRRRQFRIMLLRVLLGIKLPYLYLYIYVYIY